MSQKYDALKSCVKQNEASGTFLKTDIAVLLLTIKQIYGLHEPRLRFLGVTELIMKGPVLFQQT
jgi:hypothetical protein